MKTDPRPNFEAEAKVQDEQSSSLGDPVSLNPCHRPLLGSEEEGCNGVRMMLFFIVIHMHVANHFGYTSSGKIGTDVVTSPVQCMQVLLIQC